MSHPLKSSWARSPSSKSTECGPPPWNWTLMSRPMDGDGTLSVSTGSPFRENADAFGVELTTVSATAAVAAATISAPTRRAHCANTSPTRAKLPTSPPLPARPRTGVIVLLPSYLGHRCDNRPWRGHGFVRLRQQATHRDTSTRTANLSTYAWGRGARSCESTGSVGDHTLC